MKCLDCLVKENCVFYKDTGKRCPIPLLRERRLRIKKEYGPYKIIGV